MTKREYLDYLVSKGIKFVRVKGSYVPEMFSHSFHTYIKDSNGYLQEDGSYADKYSYKCIDLSGNGFSKIENTYDIDKGYNLIENFYKLNKVDTIDEMVEAMKVLGIVE